MPIVRRSTRSVVAAHGAPVELRVVERVVEPEQALGAAVRDDRLGRGRAPRVRRALRAPARAGRSSSAGRAGAASCSGPRRPRAAAPPPSGRRRRRTSRCPRPATAACGPTCPGSARCASSRARASTARSAGGSARQRESTTIMRCASTRSTSSAGAGPKSTETLASATTPRAIRPVEPLGLGAVARGDHEHAARQVAGRQVAADLAVGAPEPGAQRRGVDAGRRSRTTCGARAARTRRPPTAAARRAARRA